MNFEDGSCTWDDMEDSFEISAHALQIHTPMRRNGDIDCANSNGERLYPRLDYSKGFPDWWHLDRTDIKVPSEHTQHGKRYAAEISLAHFYEVDHYKNQVGYVTMFMQDYPGEKPWNYLDKLICKWRREEEKQREKCGLPPAPVYKMCELYRGQERTAEDLKFDDETADSNNISDKSQINRPNAVPIEDFGKNPDAKSYPLKLCQGNCKLAEECAPGLTCHEYDDDEAVPGCIGGENYRGGSNICVFDPFGEGYNSGTDNPTDSPTKTPSPTITPLPPKPAVDFGGTPLASLFPLQRCQGDCDSDSDCALGLFCFQRNSNQAIPGCIGGEENPMMTDYCILDPRSDVGYTDPETTSPTLKPTGEPTTVSPTVAPTQPPTNIPTALPTKVAPVPFVPRPTGPEKQVKNLGWEPKFKLGECEGDCDNDSDCKPGLVCFSRQTSRVAVPGCAGGEQDSTLTDYCTYPEIKPVDENDAIIRKVESLPPTQSPSKSPTKSPTEPPTTIVEDEPIPLNGISWSPPGNQKLGRCEGDCDVDDDCGDGLKCFQRFTPNKIVPGCIGGDEDGSLMDYCVIDRSTSEDTADEATKQTLPPVVLPAPVPVSVTVAPVPAPLPDSTPDFVAIPDNASITKRGIPPKIDCAAYEALGVNIDRFCDNDHKDMCCQAPRSSSNYCHENYGLFGDDLASACHHCCLEDRNEAYVVGPANPVKPELEIFTNEQCANEVDNTARICRDRGCCNPEYSDTRFCQGEIAKHGDDWERICWYCCYPAKEFDIARRSMNEISAKSEEDMRVWHRQNPRKLGSKDKKFMLSHMERELIVREENFVEKGLKDEDAYFQEIHNAFQGRQLQTPVKENYEDVHWWPYEWLLKVGTEYYYRYEGSMTVPPCYSVNHWRVMKDPIRVAKHQITELERLLAWRINGKCQPSTAGKEREGNPDAVDVNRPLQELEKGHRMVFCECQDWPSKFPQERQWCEKWQKRDPYLRLFENPYNWEQNGF